MKWDRLWLMAVFQLKQGREMSTSEPNICENMRIWEVTQNMDGLINPMGFIKGDSTSKDGREEERNGQKQACWCDLTKRVYLCSSYVVIMQSWKPSGFFKAPCVTLDSIWLQRQTERGTEGDKREFVLSADQRRVSLKFLSFTFLPDGANYV